MNKNKKNQSETQKLSKQVRKVRSVQPENSFIGDFKFRMVDSIQHLIELAEAKETETHTSDLTKTLEEIHALLQQCDRLKFHGSREQKLDLMSSSISLLNNLAQSSNLNRLDLQIHKNKEHLIKSIIDKVWDSILLEDITFQECQELFAKIIDPKSKEMQDKLAVYSVGTLGGKKILFKWYMLFVFVQKLFLLSLPTLQKNKKNSLNNQQKNSKNRIDELINGFINTTLVQHFSIPLANTFVAALISGIQGYQFPICLLFLNNFAQFVTKSFSMQKITNNLHFGGLFCPEVISSTINGLLKIRRVSVKEQYVEVRNFTEMISCSYCNGELDPQSQQNATQKVLMISVANNSIQYRVLICKGCHRNFGPLTVLSAIPFTSQWREENSQKRNLLDILILKSCHKTAQEADKRFALASEYPIPQRIAINSLKESFPDVWSLKILLHLYDSHPVYGIKKTLKELLTILLIITSCAVPSQRKKALKLMNNSSFIELLLGGEGESETDSSFLEQFRNFRERYLQMLHSRLTDSQNGVKLEVLELFTSIYLQNGRDKEFQLFSTILTGLGSINNQSDFVEALANFQKILQNEKKPSFMFQIFEILDEKIISEVVKAPKSLDYIFDICSELLRRCKSNCVQTEFFSDLVRVIKNENLSLSFVFKITCEFDQILLKIFSSSIEKLSARQASILNQVLEAYKNKSSVLEADGDIAEIYLQRMIAKMLEEPILQKAQNIENKSHLSKLKILHSLLSFPLTVNANIKQNVLKLSQFLYQEIQQCPADELKLKVSLLFRANQLYFHNCNKKVQQSSQPLINGEVLTNFQLIVYYKSLAKEPQAQNKCNGLIREIMILCYLTLETEQVKAQNLTREQQKKTLRGNSKKNSKQVKNPKSFDLDPQTIQAYDLCCQVLLRKQNETCQQILAVLGSFWSDLPELFFRSKQAIQFILCHMKLNNSTIESLYSALLNTIDESNFTNLQNKGLSILESIFKKTGELAYELGKQNQLIRICFYKVIRTLLKTGNLLSVEVSSFVLVGICDQNQTVSQYSIRILDQAFFSQTSQAMKLFANFQKSLRELYLNFTKGQKIENLNILFEFNKPSQASKMNKRKLNEGSNFRVRTTFLKKICQCLDSSTSSYFQKEPEFYYFLLTLIGEAQRVLPKQFIELYYSLEALINSNCLQVKREMKQLINKNFKISNTENTVKNEQVNEQNEFYNKEDEKKQIKLRYKVASIIFAVRFLTKMSNSIGIKEVEKKQEKDTIKPIEIQKQSDVKIANELLPILIPSETSIKQIFGMFTQGLGKERHSETEYFSIKEQTELNVQGMRKKRTKKNTIHKSALSLEMKTQKVQFDQPQDNARYVLRKKTKKLNVH